MTTYPESVITENSKGKKEARVLVERGEYVRYTYYDPETDRPVAIGKETIVLKNEEGKYEKLLIVPIAGGKNFVFRKKDVDAGSKVWNPAKKKEESVF